MPNKANENTLFLKLSYIMLQTDVINQPYYARYSKLGMQKKARNVPYLN